MPTRTDEVSFATFVAAQRPLLQGIAYLMYGDVGRGRAIVDVTMASLYDNWPVEGDPRDIVLRQVLDARPSQLDVPWVHRSRVELVDTATPGLNPPVGIVARPCRTRRRPASGPYPSTRRSGTAATHAPTGRPDP